MDVYSSGRIGLRSGQFFGAVRSLTLQMIGLFVACCLSANGGMAAEEAEIEYVAIPEIISQIDFEGDFRFPASELRSALLKDSEFQLAARLIGRVRKNTPWELPANPEEFLHVLENRVVAGFQANGFPDVKVQASSGNAPGKVKVKITTGPQYRNGKIEIHGTKLLNPQGLEDALVKHRLPKNAVPVIVKIGDEQIDYCLKESRPGKPGSFKTQSPPLWKPGEVATFHETKLAELTEAVRNGCTAQGYHQAEFRTELRRETDGKATFNVTIKSEGPQTELGIIEVWGLTRDEPEDLIRYLGLKPGLPAGDRLATEVRTKLFDSGKFLDFKVTLESPRENRSELSIEVRENPHAAPVSKPCPPAEEAACRFARWVNQFPGTQEDLLVELEGKIAGKLIYSYQAKSVLAQMERRVKQNLEYGAAVLLTDEGIEFSSLHARKQLAFPRMSTQYHLAASFLNSPPDSKGKTGFAKFGAGAGSRDPATQIGKLPILFDVIMSPSSAIQLLCSENCKFQPHDGQATFTNDWGFLVIDFATGRLIEAKFETEDDNRLRVVTGMNLFPPVIEEYRKLVAGFQREKEEVAIADACLRFVHDLIDPHWWCAGEADAERTKRIQKGLATADKLLQSGAMRPLIDAFVKTTGPRDEEMRAWPECVASEYIAMASEFVEELFPLRSGICRVTSDLNIYMNNHNEASSAIVDQFRADLREKRLGPLAETLGACHYLYYNNLNTAKIFASAARNNLSLERVNAELNELLQENAGITTVFDKFVLAVGECSPDEWQNFATELFPSGLSEPLLKIGQLCRESPRESRRGVQRIVEYIYPTLIDQGLRGQLELWAGHEPLKMRKPFKKMADPLLPSDLEGQFFQSTDPAALFDPPMRK